jgi:phosphoribosylamine---glycine ligase
MKRNTRKSAAAKRVMGWGVGAFTQGILQILKESGAEISTYLTRDYAHFPPGLVGPVFHKNQWPDPCRLFQEMQPDLVVPMSIDWAQAPWAAEFLRLNVPILSPIGEAMRIERERDFARILCHKFKIPFPRSHVARNRLEAEAILRRYPGPYVIKNPLCSPTSPIHTIVCETERDTWSWLAHLDYAEGVFLQEYLGRAEAGHIAFVCGGKIHSLVTNQEYKRAFNGNMGIVAGAPLGGLVEQDPEDRYGLARELIRPLLPWLREVRFNGPLQATAVRHEGRWQVIEYNIRLGVTCGPMILRLLEDPLDVLLQVARNRNIKLKFRKSRAYGCSLTLAGHGYPYTQVKGPLIPVSLREPLDCDLWWNEVSPGLDGHLFASGHRVADVIAIAETLDQAIANAYVNIRKIRCLGSYYRTDIGQSLWPPGSD